MRDVWRFHKGRLVFLSARAPSPVWTSRRVTAYSFLIRLSNSKELVSEDREGEKWTEERSETMEPTSRRTVCLCGAWRRAELYPPLTAAQAEHQAD